MILAAIILLSLLFGGSALAIIVALVQTWAEGRAQLKYGFPRPKDELDIGPYQDYSE